MYLQAILHFTVECGDSGEHKQYTVYSRQEDTEWSQK